MDPRHLFAGDGEHAERVIRAQVGFDGEGELRQIGQIFQIIRVDPGGVKAVAIEGDVVIGVAQRPAQALGLQGRDLIPAGDFDRVQCGAIGGEVFHGGYPSSSSKCCPLTWRDSPRSKATVRPSWPVTVTS